MGIQLLHTPEGVRDIYGTEYEKKLKAQSLLHDIISSYGYQDIQTPSFEFIEVFGSDMGTTDQKELYRFFDKDGNTLALRSDFTPGIARCAAKYFMDNNDTMRFCYCGNAFNNLSNLQGKLKETTQMGVELVGDDSAYADAEVLALTVESLLNVGLKNFQISVGNVEFFKGICEELHFSDETENIIHEYISNKNFFGAQEYLTQLNIDRAGRDKLLKTSDLVGSEDVLDTALQMSENKRSQSAINRLHDIYEVLKLYGYERYISFDLGMLTQYHYYTGMIFKVYTYGTGDAIVKGGRYNTLLAKFGKNAPSIGFVILIDDLMQSLSRQKISIPYEKEKVELFFRKDNFQEVLLKAKELREKGIAVELKQSDETEKN